MEYALRFRLIRNAREREYVLILIVMEYALRSELTMNTFSEILTCLNPYCNGICT